MLQSTWFTALLAIDEYRVEARRDACLCCLVHPGHVSAETAESAESAETGDTRGRSASVWTRLFSGLSRLHDCGWALSTDALPTANREIQVAK